MAYIQDGQQWDRRAGWARCLAPGTPSRGEAPCRCCRSLTLTLPSRAHFPVVNSTCSDFNHGSALHIAASNLCLGAAKCLLEHGANPALRVLPPSSPPSFPPPLPFSRGASPLLKHQQTSARFTNEITPEIHGVVILQHVTFIYYKPRFTMGRLR